MGAGVVNQAVELVPIDHLRPHPQNRRTHDLPSIRASFDEQGGFVGVIVANRPRGNAKRGVILGGHGAWTVAKEREMEQVPVCWVTVTDRQAKKLLLALNPRESKGYGWEDDGLAELLAELDKDGGLAGTGYDDDDLAALLDQMGDDELDGDDLDDEPDEPEVPAPPKRPVTNTGDVWTLDEHRVVCGDAFEDGVVALALGSDTVADAVLTDPPYAIYGSSTGIASDIADDKMIRPFFENLGRLLHASVKEFGHVYVCCDWRSYPTVHHGAKAGELAPKNVLVWDKGSFGMGSNWPNAHEFVAFFTRLPRQRAMSSSQKTGQRSVLSHPNILRFPRVAGAEREHNAAKPVAMLSHIIEQATDPGELVLDAFGGSGSTLMACDTTGRRAAVVEMEPKWCDVIVARWERTTGRTPKLNGKPRSIAG